MSPAGLQVGGLPPRFGNWHTVYTRMNRWSKNGVLDRVFAPPARSCASNWKRYRWTAPSSRSTPTVTGALKKTDPSPSASPGRLDHQDSLVAADARTAITFSLSPGQAHDAPEGRKLLTRLGPQCPGPFLLMDRAYEGNETRWPWPWGTCRCSTPKHQRSTPGSMTAEIAE